MYEVRKEKGRIIFFGIILLDQASKLLAKKLGVVLINRGISFGVLINFYVVALLTVLSLCLLIILWYFKKMWNVGLILITSGGIGNLIDRLFYGGVEDFIKLPFIPLFNLADMAICMGAVLAVVDFAKLKKV